MSFNAKEVKDKCVEWIREWFKENGNQCKAVIGISGGVDSSVVAALCGSIRERKSIRRVNATKQPG